jgi:hypothetical protein
VGCKRVGRICTIYDDYSILIVLQASKEFKSYYSMTWYPNGPQIITTLDPIEPTFEGGTSLCQVFSTCGLRVGDFVCILVESRRNIVL